MIMNDNYHKTMRTNFREKILKVVKDHTFALFFILGPFPLDMIDINLRSRPAPPLYQADLMESRTYILHISLTNRRPISPPHKGTIVPLQLN